jgi:aromatic-L-amino-acid decarboxylase
MLTQTSLNGIFCVRFVVGAARTNEEHIQEAYNIIVKEAKSASEIWNKTLNRVATAG